MKPLLPTDWANALQPKLDNQYLEKISIFLDTVYAHETIYPKRNNVFAALQATPLATVKVVILGQDPYPNPEQAQGMSFSVPEGMALPKSLINIYKELSDDLQKPAPQMVIYIVGLSKVFYC